MKYYILNKSYSLRNEATCSFLVRKNMYINENMDNYQNVYTFPPFIGFILSNIGQKEYSHSIATISKELNIDSTLLQKFLSQLIEQPQKSVIFMGKEIVFPENLLVHSNLNDSNKYYTTKDFFPMNKYELCRPKTPLMMNIMVTEKCNTNCIYCYAKRNTRKEMSTSEIANVFKSISLSGIINLTLTGGDIFARNDWFEIISLSKKANFNYLISTKTILEEQDIHKLKQLGIHQIQFSLDSITDNVLMNMLNVSKNYNADKLKHMFKTFDVYGIKISLRTVLCKQNARIDIISDLCDFVNCNTSITSWTITPAFYSENKDNYNNYAVDNDMLVKVFSFLKRHKMRIRPLFNKINKDGYILQRATSVEDYVEDNQNCYANTYSMSILPSGDCTICEMLYYNPDFIIGNIKDDSIEDIWNSKKALDLYAPSKEQIMGESACSTCKVFEKCRRSFTKKICYVDVMKVHHNFNYPDPKCPQSSTYDYIL